MIDLADELSAWLNSPRVRELLGEITRGAVREEIQEVLRAELKVALPSLEELVDTKEAARVLQMTEVAIRKAVTRGQIKCVRIGRRVRFRRADLLKRAG